MDIVSTLYAGVAGAIAMFVFMELITLSKLANADMVRAVGSLITRKEENSFKVGIILHLTAGVIFSFLYCYILNLLQTNDIVVYTFVGAFGGFTHGLLVSYFILIEGQNRHPVEKFQTAGFEVALAHVVGHVIYGAIVGYSYAYQTIINLKPEGTFSGWDIYQIYMTVIGTLTLIALVVMSIKNNMHKN